MTDSMRPAIFRIAAADIGTPSADPLPPSTDACSIFVPGAFNLNGIVATSHDRYLIAAQTATGQLWRITIADGTITPVDLGGATLPNVDGLALSGHALYAMQNALGNLVRIDLKPLYAAGTIASVTHDPTFDFPTAVGLIPGRALVVNSQFENRGGTPTPPFTVSNVQRP